MNSLFNASSVKSYPLCKMLNAFNHIHVAEVSALQNHNSSVKLKFLLLFNEFSMSRAKEIKWKNVYVWNDLVINVK